MGSPIVSAETLATWIAEGRPDLRVVDVRWYLGQPAGSGRAAYDAGHIPGAIHVDVDTDLVAPSGPGRHPLPEPGAFAAKLASKGIGDGDLVVVYDDLGGWVASRLWWMLDDLGFGANGRGGVLVLDGGLQAWTTAGRPLTTDVPYRPPSELHLAPAWSRVIDRAALKDRLGEVLLLDARGGPRYRGETEPIDAVPGHIPTAVNAPTDGNLGEDGRFRPPAELAARFKALRTAAAVANAGCGRPGTPLVTSCGSGVSATHNALALRISAGRANRTRTPDRRAGGVGADESASGRGGVRQPEDGRGEPRSRLPEARDPFAS